MTQHAQQFVRLDLPPIPDLWRGARGRVEDLVPTTEPSPAITPVPSPVATATPARPASAFPRPTIGRGVAA